jgi:hypothetical protein
VIKIMRFFNTAGPVDCQRHYCLPPLTRFDLDEVLRLIQQMKYFVLHAPRQTGKTSCLLALLDYLNNQGDYRCAYVNVEVAQAAREDVAAAMQAMRSRLSPYYMYSPWRGVASGERFGYLTAPMSWLSCS